MKAQVGKSVGAMVGTGILVIGLVVAPSHVDGATTEVRTVQLAAVALPSAPGVNSSAVAIPLELNSATGRLQVNNSALATTPTAISIPPALIGVIGPFILFAPIFAIVILASPVLLPAALLYYLQDAISYLFNSLNAPDDGAAAAGVEARVADPAAASLDPVAFVSENAKILGDGIAKSGERATVALAAQALSPFVVAFLSLAAPTHAPEVILAAVRASESFWTGAHTYPFGLDYNEIVPGFYIPADVTPTGNPGDPHDVALNRVAEGTVPAATVEAINQVARNLTAAGVPKVLEQALLSSEKIGVTVLQAWDLVRGATVGVGQNGLTGIQNAVFGDPNAPDVPLDPYDPGSQTAPSIAQLGAVRTLGTGVRQALENVGGSLTTSVSSQQSVGARELGNASVVAVKSEPGNEDAIVGAGRDTGPTAGAANPIRKTPIRSAIANARNDITKVVAQVRDSVKNALSGGGDKNQADDGEGGTP